MVPAVTASATHHADVTIISGNSTCKKLLDNESAYEIKVEPTSAIANGATFGPITFTGVNDAKTLMGFTSTAPIDAVFVKGGPVGGALYSYDPPTTADSNMGVGGYGVGPNAISHVSFCWNEEPVVLTGLSATKTATATYDRDITWTLTKSATPTSLSGLAGATAGSSTWSITATKTVVDSDFLVTGSIVISNPNAVAVPVTVTDTLDDGTTASVACPSSSVPAGSVTTPGSLTCTYTATPTSAAATQNNAVVSSGTTGIAGTTALAAVVWDVTTTGDAGVTLGDERLEISQLLTDTATVNVPEAFSCPSDPTLYTNGSYSRTESNTATLDGATTDLDATAAVVVDCSLAALLASKTAAGAYDRVITWQLTKTVDDDSHSGAAGTVAGSSTWSVTADKSVAELNHTVTGAITITNNAVIPQTFTVTDVLSTGAIGDVTCPSYTVAAGDQVVCTYTASTAGATLNTATVTAPGNPAVEATATVSYTATTIGQESLTLADPRFGFSEVVSDDRTVTFPESFACSDVAADYTNGANTRTETNTATLTGTGVAYSASETVDVSCTLAPLTVSKTAAGSYDNTIAWSLDKTVDRIAHEGLAGQLAGSSTWLIEVDRTDTPGNYQVIGEITITNPSAVDVPFTVRDVLNDGTAETATVAAVTCPATTVPAGESIVCSYLASPDDATATVNHAQVKGDGHPTQTGRARVSWYKNDLGAQTVTLTDPRLEIDTQTSTSVTFDPSESFFCSADPTLYTDGEYSYPAINTAYLNGTGVSEYATASVNVDCTLAALTATKTAAGSYDRLVTWGLTKTVDDDSHDGLAGQLAGSSVWTVTATKTVEELDHEVTGAITVGNTAAIPQTFTVEDLLDNGAVGVVTCADGYTVPAGGQVVCTYTATGEGATLNTATVTAPGNGAVEATAAVSYAAADTIGDDEVTLADLRFGHSELISGTTTRTFTEPFTCSSTASDYVNGGYSSLEVNTATLTGPSTTAEATEDVLVDCTLPPLTATKSAAASYDNTITWTLAKSVDPSSHSGYFGQLAGSSTWTVTADRTDVEGNFAVTGQIVVTNPSAIDVPFSVTDALDDTTGATVTCPATTVPAGGSVTCTYTAAPGGRTATLNTATVTGTGNAAVEATAPVSFVRNDIGDSSVTLADPRFASSQVISADTTVTFDEDFFCSGDLADYPQGSWSGTFVNVATLDGDHTDLEASATVSIDCTGYDETATGAGTQWPGTKNWFMYTAYSPDPVDLIAGQHYDAGDITMVRDGAQTHITITLHDGFVMAPVENNVKIIDMAKAPKKYVQPGAFPHKFTEEGPTFTVTVPTASFYGIHLDVVRLS